MAAHSWCKCLPSLATRRNIGIEASCAATEKEMIATTEVIENSHQGAAQKPKNPVGGVEDAVRGTASAHRNHPGDGRPHDRFLRPHPHSPQGHSRKCNVEIDHRSEEH